MIQDKMLNALAKILIREEKSTTRKPFMTSFTKEDDLPYYCGCNENGAFAFATAKKQTIQHILGEMKNNDPDNSEINLMSKSMEKSVIEAMNRDRIEENFEIVDGEYRLNSGTIAKCIRSKVENLYVFYNKKYNSLINPEHIEIKDNGRYNTIHTVWDDIEFIIFPIMNSKTEEEKKFIVESMIKSSAEKSARKKKKQTISYDDICTINY